MKLGEFVYWEKFLYEVIEFIGETAEQHGNKPVRVEVHSLDPEPWPTERPPEWGVGCWCRIEEWRPFGSTIRSVVVIHIFSSGTEITIIKWVDIETGEIGSTRFDMIQRFGPRAGVPR